MAQRTVVVMPGDGIGRIVLPEALRVLEAAGFHAEWVPADIGWQFWVDEGNALPERTVELLSRHKLGLFGAITSKPKERAEAELHPDLRGRGHVYFSPIVGLRQRLGLDVCLRPCRSFPGNPLNLVRRSADGGIEEPRIDVVVFRQNTEDLYAGVEWTDPPRQVLDALGTHPRFAAFAGTPPADMAIGMRIFTRRACRRIVRAAFEHARRHGYRSVTICEKSNVLRETSGIMDAAGREVAREFPEVELASTNVDTQMMWLTKSPESSGVIVAGNMFGDIVSDAFAGLVGGLGFAASGNLGEAAAVFEPTHGSAPRYAGIDPPIVNPLAMILSGAMLLDHVGEVERAAAVRAAVAAVIAEGRVRTFDMLRLPGGPGVLDRGAASTAQVTDAVIARLGAGAGP